MNKSVQRLFTLSLACGLLTLLPACAPSDNTSSETHSESGELHSETLISDAEMQSNLELIKNPETSDTDRMTAIMMLGGQKAPEVMELMTQIIQKPEPAMSKGAALTVIKHANNEALYLENLKHILENESDEFTRIQAVKTAISPFGPSFSSENLGPVLMLGLKDQSDTVKLSTVKALNQIQYKAAVSELEALSQSTKNEALLEHTKTALQNLKAA